MSDETKTQRVGVLPSIAQMANRAGIPHRAILRSLAANGDLGFVDPMSVRLYSATMATLRRWEAIDEHGRITQRGRDLIAFISLRETRAVSS